MAGRVGNRSMFRYIVLLFGFVWLLFLVAYDFHETKFRDENGEWVNWDRQQRCKPARMEQPRSVTEIQELVRLAGRTGKKVRVAGAGHSFSPCVCTEDILINLDRLNRVLNMTQNLVTVEAGIRIHQLNELLALHGLRMKNLGHIAEQSIAGAILTGTHGTGIRFGSLSTLVQALQIVLANGSLVTASQTENPELFNAARVSFGSLGVIVSVTLVCSTSLPMRRIESAVKTKDMVTSIKNLVQENDHVILWHVLHTNVGRVIIFDYQKVDSPEALSKHRFQVTRFLQENLVMKFFSVCLFLSSLFPESFSQFNSKFLVKVLSDEEFIDRSDRVFNGGYPSVYTEMEYFFDFDNGLKAFEEVIRLSEEEEEIDGLRLPKITSNLPIVLRFVAKDDIYLSTQYGRDSLVLSYSIFRNQQVMRRSTAHLERVAQKYGGRPHWGKVHNLSAKELRPLYPMFDRFVALRDQIDPQQVFVNDYVRKVLGINSVGEQLIEEK